METARAKEPGSISPKPSRFFMAAHPHCWGLCDPDPVDLKGVANAINCGLQEAGENVPIFMIFVS